MGGFRWSFFVCVCVCVCVCVRVSVRPCFVSLFLFLFLFFLRFVSGACCCGCWCGRVRWNPRAHLWRTWREAVTPNAALGSDHTPPTAAATPAPAPAPAAPAAPAAAAAAAAAAHGPPTRKEVARDGLLLLLLLFFTHSSSSRCQSPPSRPLLVLFFFFFYPTKFRTRYRYLVLLRLAKRWPEMVFLVFFFYFLVIEYWVLILARYRCRVFFGVNIELWFHWKENISFEERNKNWVSSNLTDR